MFGSFTFRHHVFSLVFRGLYLCPHKIKNLRNNSNAYGGIESSKQMQKLLNRNGSKTKRKWYQPHVAAPLELSGRQQKPGKKGVSESQGHRARQLSHVLYSKICQIINSGELSEELLSKQILVTRVKMHPSFTGINVYWDAQRSDAPEIEILLNGLSGKLRSLLISYHVLGRIPSITFVKDKARGDVTRLNQLFEVADYGPDYSPSGERDQSLIMSDDRWLIDQRVSSKEHPEHTPQNNPEMTAELDRDMLKNVTTEAGWGESAGNFQYTNQDSSGQSPGAREVAILSSRLNMYGLPRDDLMKKVMAQKKKVKYQASEGGSTLLPPPASTSSSASLFSNYSKLKKSRANAKERLLLQRDSTKTKQRLLEQEFDEVQSLLHRNTPNDAEHYDDADDDYNDYEENSDKTIK